MAQNWNSNLSFSQLHLLFYIYIYIYIYILSINALSLRMGSLSVILKKNKSIYVNLLILFNGEIVH